MTWALFCAFSRRFARRAIFWLPVLAPAAVAVAIWITTSPLARLWTDRQPRPVGLDVVTQVLGSMLCLTTFVIAHWLPAEERRRGTIPVLAVAPWPWAVPLAMLAFGTVVSVLTTLISIGPALRSVEWRDGVPYGLLIAGTVRFLAVGIVLVCLGLASGLLRPTWDSAVAAGALAIAAAAALFSLATPLLLTLVVGIAIGGWMAIWRGMRAGIAR